MVAPNWQPPQALTSPITSVARATLQPSQALIPTGEPPPPDATTLPPQLRPSPWKGAFLILAFAIVAGASVWMWYSHSHGSAAKLPQEKKAASPAPVAVPPRVTRSSPRPKFAMPDIAALSADAKRLVEALFKATTPEERAACILDADKYRSEIEGMLSVETSQRPGLRVLARIPGLPLTLPGGKPEPLFRLNTSRFASGALVRLAPSADGSQRIFWPLFYETHERKLENFLKLPAENNPTWFYMGLRPSHGLDIPADLRSKYLTFDVQTAATSDPHFVACVERDSPLGRFMDRESEWGRVYLARLLVRRLDIEADAPSMLVVDCEGAKER